MDQDNKAKAANTTAPQSSDVKTEAPSAVVRNLGLIKAMAIIMAVLIVAALAVIIVTIYNRLTAANSAKAIQQNELVIPTDSRITGASLGDKGQLLVIIEDKTGQQLWQLDASGKIQRKTRITPKR
jgi:cell division protein FtsL